MDDTSVDVKQHACKTSIRIIALVASTLLLSSCLPDAPPPCAPTPFEKTVEAEIKGGHLYFDIKDLLFLEDKNIVYNDIDLQATLKGRHKHEEDIEISLNGLKVSRKDGGKCVDRYDDDSSYTHSHHKLYKFFMNGGAPFSLFLAQIKKNKGVLKVSLRGKEKHLISASIRFSGNKYGSCNPNPPGGGGNPEPTLDTKIDSVVPSSSVTSSRDVQFQFSSNIQGSTYYCSLDSATAAPCTSPVSYTGLNNGSHNFSVYGKSPKGAVESTPATYAWSVDALPPSVDITNRASLANLSRNNSINFEFASNEQGIFECRLDENAPTTCESPISYSGLTDGLHVFYVHAIDSTGNTGADATFQWTVDQTAPIAQIVDVVPSSGMNNVRTKTITFGANETSRFECSIDNGAFASCESPLEMSGLADGPHWFAVRPVDTAGNTGVAVSYSWAVDTAAPQITIGSVNPAQGSNNVKNIYADFTLSEVATAYCSFDNGPSAECASSYSASDVSAGSHQLVIYAQDAAGNRSPDTVLSWTMDFTLPVLSWGQITPSSSRFSSTSLNAEVISSENSTLQASLDGVNLNISQSPINLTGLSEGSHQLSVIATDSVGNTSQTLVYDFVVDLTAPSLSLSANPQNSLTNQDSMEFTLLADENSTLQCNLDEAGFADCESPVSFSGLVDGDHNFKARALDTAGNVSSVIEHNWTIDTRAPVASIAATQNGRNINFTLSADESNVNFTCYLNSAPIQPCQINVNYTGLPDNDYNFHAIATDAAGNASAEATWIFSVRSPPLTRIDFVMPSQFQPSNSTTRMIVFSSNTSGSTFLCSLNNAPETPCTSPLQYTDLTHGAYTFTVKAVSPFGVIDTVGTSVSWFVDTIAPVISNLTSSPTTSSITVTWTTDEAATHRVEYGTSPTNLDRSTTDSGTYSTSHSVTLIGLSRGTLYYMRVIGKDAAGNEYISAVIQRKTNN